MSDKKTKSLEEYNSLLKQFEERGDLVEELQATVDKYKKKAGELEEENSVFAQRVEELTYQNDINEGDKEKAIEEISKLKIDFSEMRSFYATASRELRIAEENLTAANKSLRGKEAQVEQLERELSYARENERTLRENERIFRTALKAAL